MTTINAIYKNKPQQERSETKAKNVLAAAGELFCEKGYRATTIRMIADRSKVSIGSLYHIFPDKTAIARSISQQYSHDALELFADFGNDVKSLDDLKGAISQFVRGAAKLQQTHPGYYAISRSNNPSLQDDVTRPMRKPLLSMFIEKISVGFEIKNGRDELRRVLDIAIETTRHFLNLASSQSRPMSENQQNELEAMLTAYIVSRFEEILAKQ